LASRPQVPEKPQGVLTRVDVGILGRVAAIPFPPHRLPRDGLLEILDGDAGGDLVVMKTRRCRVKKWR
ncbi:MAG: hypothetical protein M1608_16135, partial [Candidatus Omnitrophica bacterium]|nr:hypothetical protein [Candidatus Omnitrophota bacterium]